MLNELRRIGALFSPAMPHVPHVLSAVHGHHWAVGGAQPKAGTANRGPATAAPSEAVVVADIGLFG